MQEILRSYEEDHVLQKDLAERFKISAQLVSSIIKSFDQVVKQ